MFDPTFLDFDRTSEKIYGESLDHFPNVGGFGGWASHAAEEKLSSVESMIMSILGIQSMDGAFGYTRDVLAQLGAGATILVQPLFQTSDVAVSSKQASQELFRYKSSVASYDRTLQEGLYEWSLEAITEFL